VIVENDLNSAKMALAIIKALMGNRKIPLDILVNTSKDFDEYASEPALQNRIKKEGVLLYAQFTKSKDETFISNENSARKNR
jgi:hypothetical protein